MLGLMNVCRIYEQIGFTGKEGCNPGCKIPHSIECILD